MTYLRSHAVNEKSNENSRSSTGAVHLPKSIAPRIACDDIMAVAIALVSDQEIQSMTRDDMLDTLRVAQRIPRSPARVEKITEFDEGTLRRVTHLVRRWARIRVNELSKERGSTPYFRDRF